MVAAVGIDLAWKEPGITGLCVLNDGILKRWDADVYSNTALTEIVHGIDCERCIVTIDAPLEVPNESGIRSCERAFKKTKIHGHYLSVLGSNRAFLSRQFGSIRGELLLQGLVSDRISVYETFPSASVVGMFGRRIPYKFSAGKTKAGVIAGMGTLLNSFRKHERFSTFAGELDSHVSHPLSLAKTRTELKYLEDKVDAFICAYTAWQLSVFDNKVRIVKEGQDDGSIVFSYFDTPVFVGGNLE